MRLCQRKIPSGNINEQLENDFLRILALTDKPILNNVVSNADPLH